MAHTHTFIMLTSPFASNPLDRVIKDKKKRKKNGKEGGRPRHVSGVAKSLLFTGVIAVTSG